MEEHGRTDSIRTLHQNISDLPGAEGVTARPLRAVCSPASTRECLLLSLKRNTLSHMTSDTQTELLTSVNSVSHNPALASTRP